MILLLRVQLYPKLDENACDCLLIILLHDLYHEAACQERLAKILLCNIGSCAQLTFHIVYMHDMPIGRKTLHISVRFVLHEVHAWTLSHLQS